ncbi:MAG TPA: hypothetical protein VMT15_06815 [Bryobacteraceae bacterium]|nr:hypothetical protein [Bryobacteraceae bacterium]
MKNYRLIASLATLALLVAGYLMMPATMKAADTPDSPEITKLLADARVQAIDLRHDAEDMEMYTRSSYSPESYAEKLELMKQHVNTTGKLLAKLRDAEANGSIWQKTAIWRVDPLLKELAENTQRMITFFNANKTKTHFPEFRDWVKANSDLAGNLETLIKDFLTYGDLKQKLDRLGSRLEITG